ncbi:DUF881 domain-containing protein [Ureibacillus acetophenoni]|uniref:Uncharacterized protein YlxW (UPF0749 family) n=1 Tax=Ureibacillus acetophenoni TaxID=614649 RepID=A0A285U503_9BACL|nr:DUF881 domain-containing protein [Ureibacillus acetophenoni]SOC35351.1 uncharacterized protein YlxW (UPF0749 family) [Ureibacillus acetophenoni]
MNMKVVTRITIVSFIVGLMIAVQYNTVKEPSARDTRDSWELRQALSEEKKRHSQLLSEILALNDVVNKYKNNETENLGDVLSNTVEHLKQEAGLLEVTGPGITITISPAMELVQSGFSIKPISPELLYRLVNEINRFEGQFIEIDGQRVVHTTAIRDINGSTTVNGIPISKSDVEIKVITDSYEKAEKLNNYLNISSFRDAFYIDNLNLVIGKPEKSVTIAEYDRALENEFLIEQKGE